MSETEDIQLNLKWDNFSSHLALSFDSCYESQQFVDVSLVCKDGKVIKAHKVILANTSKFFHRLLTENQHPHPMIVMHDIDVDDLRSLMSFMYCGEVQVFQNDLKRLLDLADTLEISGLQQIPDFDNDRTRCGNKNSTVVNDQAECPNIFNLPESPERDVDKPASNLLKYVSTLGQKNLDNSVPIFESSSKKLREMAQKIESSSLGRKTFTDSSENRLREITNNNVPKSFNILPENESESLSCKSSIRKLQELAKLLDNVNRNPTLPEMPKATSVGQKRPLHSVENGSLFAKKSNVTLVTPSTSETEPEVESNGLVPAHDPGDTGQTNDGEQFIQNCAALIKDEVEVATDCSSPPDIELDNSHNENSTFHDGENSRTSMLAAQLLKAVANKRKAAENALTEGGYSGYLGGVPDQHITTNSNTKNRNRKLAFHEPRPCDICNRVYRDAATLRQHTFTMHTAGTYFCGCGAYFFTKYDLLVHKKQAHS
ncbi:protein abrupt-like isoform X1 [Athalia rosae]|uniref:protein abrupt-like isoform X1 n=1 Tax=Athalia rosae TaxID=37344 RepID=UPI002033F3D5|nr:protein abrupt-like isoform X1 [Athalia rosae]